MRYEVLVFDSCLRQSDEFTNLDPICVIPPEFLFTTTLVAKTFHQGMGIPSALMTTMQPSLLIMMTIH